MSPLVSPVRRYAMAVAVALVALTTLVPAVGACCVMKPASAPSSMHALMPCCTPTCKLTKNTARRDADYTLAAATATPVPVTVAASVEPTLQITAGVDLQPAAFASPPSFLSHHQFRI